MVRVKGGDGSYLKNRQVDFSATLSPSHRATADQLSVRRWTLRIMMRTETLKGIGNSIPLRP
jgi:hypothetical protein